MLGKKELCSCVLILQAAEHPVLTPRSVSGRIQENKVTRTEKEGQIIIMVKEYTNEVVHKTIAPCWGIDAQPFPMQWAATPLPTSSDLLLGMMSCGVGIYLWTVWLCFLPAFSVSWQNQRLEEFGLFLSPFKKLVLCCLIQWCKSDVLDFHPVSLKSESVHGRQ